MPTEAAPLWPGSRFTETDRKRALERALSYIYRTSLNRTNFASYASDYLWCFYTLSSVVGDQSLKQEARRMGLERALAWRRFHRSLPRDADLYTVQDDLNPGGVADSLVIRDDRLKDQVRRAARRSSARDVLLFDPLTEPPPNDVPKVCKYDGAINPRGSKVCQVCKRRLQMRSRYGVWCDALITTYAAEHYGVTLGARYVDVIKLLPAMHPYPVFENGADRNFAAAVYAVTHVIYTLNNYTEYRLSPAWLPEEYQFLEDNLPTAISTNDTNLIGEFIDTLESFGLTKKDPEIRLGIEYYLAHQNADGSWGEMRFRNRYHETWCGIGALAEYQFAAGERLSFPEARPLLETLNRHNQTGVLPEETVSNFATNLESSPAFNLKAKAR